MTHDDNNHSAPSGKERPLVITEAGLAYAVNVGGLLAGQGVRDFAEWTARMQEGLGPVITPYLKAIYNKVRKEAEDKTGFWSIAEVSQAVIGNRSTEVLPGDRASHSSGPGSLAKQDLPDPLIISIHRDQVMAGDTGSVLGVLRSTLASPAHMRHYKERVGIGFDGYNDDREPLWWKSDVRRFIFTLDMEFPYWLYFLSRQFDTLPLFGRCMILPHLSGDEFGKELIDLIEQRWGPALRNVCHRVGATEQEMNALLDSGLDCLVNGPKKL